MGMYGCMITPPKAHDEKKTASTARFQSKLFEVSVPRFHEGIFFPETHIFAPEIGRPAYTPHKEIIIVFHENVSFREGIPWQILALYEDDFPNFRCR